MRKIVQRLPLLMALLVSACAVANIPDATDSPPITLEAPPTPVVGGNCEVSSDLEQWLQAVYYIRTDFSSTMNNAANQTRSQMYDEVLYLVELRNAVSARPAPDCAVNLQQALVATMQEIIETFQAYANGDLENLGNRVTEFNARLDQITAMQDQLVIRLEDQIENASQTVEP